MTPRTQRIAAMLAACGVLGACGDDRSASTEVENEVGVLSASAEDTAALVAARWTLTDGSDTLATGYTDSTGSILSTFRLSDSARLVLVVVSQAETLTTVIEWSGPGDTLKTGVNLVTDLVARTWDHASALERHGDSVARALTGIPLPYADFASPRGSRQPVAETFLGVIAQKAQRDGRPPSEFVDSIARAPGTLLHDSTFTRDLTDALRRQALPPDSQMQVVRRIDSLGGQGGKLVQSFQQDRANADSLLLASLAPWTSESRAAAFRAALLARAGTCASAVLVQPRPQFSPELVLETARRGALRTYVHLLGDMSQPPDSAGSSALDWLLDEADSTVRETFMILKIDRWFGKDVQLDQLLAPVYASTRSPSWKTSALLVSSDPAAHVAAGWPQLHGERLRDSIESALGSGRWGYPGDLLVPDSAHP